MCASSRRVRERGATTRRCSTAKKTMQMLRWNMGKVVHFASAEVVESKLPEKRETVIFFLLRLRLCTPSNMYTSHASN